MNIERSNVYAKFIEVPPSPLELYKELCQTGYFVNYSPEIFEQLSEPMRAANLVIPFVDSIIIGPMMEALAKDVGKPEALLDTVRTCLHPQTAPMLIVDSPISNEKVLMVAASHIGVVRSAELYQKANDEDKKMLRMDSLFFAVAQARILNFQTTTSLLARNLGDENNFRMENIGLIFEEGTPEELVKARLGILFEGRKVTEIKDIGTQKFFKF